MRLLIRISAFLLGFILPLSAGAQITSVSVDYILNPQSRQTAGEEYGYSIYDLMIGHTLLNRGDYESGTFTEITASADIRYQFINLDYRGSDPITAFLADAFPSDLFAFKYDLTVMQSINDQWFGVVKAGAGIFSDLKEIDINHFLLEGGIIPVYKFDSFDAGIGPFYTYAFGKPRIIPAPYFRMKGESTSNIMFTISPPTYAHLGYTFSEDLNAGLELQTIRNNYEIGDPFFSGENSLFDSPVFVFSDLTLGPVVNFSIAKDVMLTLPGGYTLRRTFEIKDGGNSERSTEVRRVLFLNTGIVATF